jgi:CelD/BcsL family acetyltransferase involved in cellulose biosynthesis
MTTDTARPGTDLAFESREGLKLRIVRLKGGEGLAAHRDACRDLATHACEPNIFYEHWMLEPALAEWAEPERVDVLLVYEDAPGRVGRLCGLFPVERRTATRSRPLPSIALWKPIHCFLCTPLLRSDVAAAALEALFHWVDRHAGSAMWMAFDHVSLDGPFAELLTHELQQRGRRGLETERFERALARTSDSADAFIRRALNGKRRHEIARHERRLRERGDLVFGSLPANDPAALEVWLTRFLDLEAAGWKGRAGSAIACRPDEQRFFLAAARNAYATGRLMIVSLELDGRPVALKLNFLTDSSQAGGFAFKIAFDESLSEFSPGMILQVENVRRIHEAPRLSWMDSCAQPGHPMMDRIWRDRRTIGDVLTSVDRMGAESSLRAYGTLLGLKRSIIESRARFRARAGRQRAK